MLVYTLQYKFILYNRAFHFDLKCQLMFLTYQEIITMKDHWFISTDKILVYIELVNTENLFNKPYIISLLNDTFIKGEMGAGGGGCKPLQTRDVRNVLFYDRT